MIVAEYIWLDAENNFRHKTKCIPHDCSTQDNIDLCDFPEWNYDGSSTGQATTAESEIVLKPAYFCVDPFRHFTDMNTDYVSSYLVLCDMYNIHNHPISNNTRSFALEIFKQSTDLKPWFGIEQEYFIIDPATHKPLGYQEEKQAQGIYYCKMGKKYGREVAEEHLRLCIEAGLTISGMNAEVASGQWEYQIGPCEGILAADQLMMSRYILEKIADKHNMVICYDPKPILNDCNGSGCHTNFSTVYMREGCKDYDGLEYIHRAIRRLADNHREHMRMYGSGNKKRMTGKNETSDYNKFTHGVGSRNTSVRIGNSVFKNKCGYFEDRRPAANMNPYIVTSMIFKTCCL